MDNSQIDTPIKVVDLDNNKNTKDFKDSNEINNESNEIKEINESNDEYIINYEYLNQSLLTVENVENILYTISPELRKISYVTYNYPNNNEIINNKYSIINIKQFFEDKNKNKNNSNNIEDNFQNLKNNSNRINEVNNNSNINPTNYISNQDLNDENIGHFIIIINNYPTCIIYPLYYINCIKLTKYLEDKCKFENIVWNYDIIQHGNSSSCGWECCKIAYDYFMKNKIEIECKDYIIQNV